MATPVLSLVIVGHEDHPIFEADLGSKGAEGGVRDERAQYLHQFVMHAALDAVDEQLWSTGAMHLGVVDRFNNLQVSAYVTAAHIKFLLLHDGRSEESIKGFFRDIYDAYLRVIMNPFFTPTTRIKSATFQQKAASEVAESDRIAAVRVETTRRITQLGRAGRPREATLQLAEMARLGVQPDAMAATALVDACARNGKMEMALSVFDELFGDFLQPDDITFSTLVRGYGESEPPQWAGISSVLGTMQQRFGLRPGTAVYTSLLSICVRTKDDDRGYEIIERMARTGVEPDDQVLEAVRQRKSLRSHLRRVYTNSSTNSSEEGSAAEGSQQEPDEGL